MNPNQKINIIKKLKINNSVLSKSSGIFLIEIFIELNNIFNQILKKKLAKSR